MEKFNKFLKDFADKWYIFIIFCVVFAAWLVFKNDFLAQLSRDLVMAMLAIAGYKRVTETTVNADTIETPNVNAASMDNSVVNVNSDSETRTA